jgi:hypothetical protein
MAVNPFASTSAVDQTYQPHLQVIGAAAICTAVFTLKSLAGFYVRQHRISQPSWALIRHSHFSGRRVSPLSAQPVKKINQ